MYLLHRSCILGLYLCTFNEFTITYEKWFQANIERTSRKTHILSSFQYNQLPLNALRHCALKHKQYNLIYTFSMALLWCIFLLSFLGTYFLFFYVYLIFFFFLKSSKFITASVISTKYNPTETCFNKHSIRSFSTINRAHHKHIALLLCSTADNKFIPMSQVDTWKVQATYAHWLLTTKDLTIF